MLYKSMRGLAFRERILSVIGTARHLGLNTHQILRQLCREGLQRRAMTPLARSRSTLAAKSILIS